MNKSKNGSRMRQDLPFVQLENCSVSIPERNPFTSLKHALLGRRNSEPNKLNILENITFSASSGDHIGIIGRNGSGKSTLLRLIAGIYPQSQGVRRVQGSIAPVLALGGGLDPELSVRANVRLGLINAGRHDSYSTELVEKILKFAELEDRSETPLRHLSSGFQARLALSLSFHQNSDILILDEVLATGDMVFVEKARRAMIDLFSKTPILFLTSHNETDITEVCSRVILVSDGQIMMDGAPDLVFDKYHHMLADIQ